MEAEYQVNVTGLVCFIIPLTKESPEECGTRIASLNANGNMHISLPGLCTLSMYAWILRITEMCLYAVICKRNVFHIFRGRIML